MFIEKFKVYCKEDEDTDNYEVFESLQEAEKRVNELNTKDKKYIIESYFENEGF